MVCPNYKPPVWRPPDNNDNNKAALAETSSDHARGWQRHSDQLCRHFAVLSSSPCKSYKIIEALSLTDFHYQVIVRLNVYTAIYIYILYIYNIYLIVISVIVAFLLNEPVAVCRVGTQKILGSHLGKWSIIEPFWWQDKHQLQSVSPLGL